MALIVLRFSSAPGNSVFERIAYNISVDIKIIFIDKWTIENQVNVRRISDGNRLFACINPRVEADFQIAPLQFEDIAPLPVFLRPKNPCGFVVSFLELNSKFYLEVVKGLGIQIIPHTPLAGKDR